MDLFSQGCIKSAELFCERPFALEEGFNRGCHFTEVWVLLVLRDQILYIVYPANNWVG
jgi:hypothetical protein